MNHLLHFRTTDQFGVEHFLRFRLLEAQLAKQTDEPEEVKAEVLKLESLVDGGEDVIPLGGGGRLGMALDLFAYPPEHEFGGFVGVGVLEHFDEELLLLEHFEEAGVDVEAFEEEFSEGGDQLVLAVVFEDERKQLAGQI